MRDVYGIYFIALILFVVSIGIYTGPKWDAVGAHIMFGMSIGVSLSSLGTGIILHRALKS